MNGEVLSRRSGSTGVGSAGGCASVTEPRLLNPETLKR
jgi:hypothetical protein